MAFERTRNFLARLPEYAGAIVGAVALAQAPGLTEAYQQRLGGHKDEAYVAVSEWQSVANRFHEGSLENLISSRLENPDPSIREDGRIAQSRQERYLSLSEACTALEEANPLIRPVLAFFEYRNAGTAETIDLETGEAMTLDPFAETLSEYDMTVPVNVPGIVYGGVGALLGAGLGFGVATPIRSRSRRKKEK